MKWEEVEEQACKLWSRVLPCQNKSIKVFVALALSLLPHPLRRMWRSLDVSRGGQQTGERAGRKVPRGAAEDFRLVGFGGWRATSLLFTAFWGGEVEVLSFSPWYPVTGHMGRVQSCTEQGLNWTLGNISRLRVWPNIETGFLESWLMPQVC